jgi:hypothetical protein
VTVYIEVREGVWIVFDDTGRLLHASTLAQALEFVRYLLEGVQEEVA